MEPEITWYIQELNRDPVTGGVTRVHWRAIAVEGEYSAKSYGELGLEYDAQDAGFVEFENLDEEIVLSWVAQNMDMNSIEDSLVAQIDSQKNPESIPGLPW